MTINEKRVVEIKDVIPNPNNPRTIKDDKFKKLVKSIKDFPEMLDARPIVVDEDMIVLGGNMRLKACISAGLTEVPIIMITDITEEKKKEFIVKDNIGYGEWDFDLLLEDYQKETLLDWGLDIKKKSLKEECVTRLADRFIVPPFSILDSRQGEWKKRKDDWNIVLDANGETREGTLFKEDTIMGSINNGVSLFDPVLAEIIFLWFAPEKSNIIDPFAGDIRKGAVAGMLGHNFTGIELRPEQYEENLEAIEKLKLDEKVKYINDDGTKILSHIEEGTQDMLFSCPPYYDLEEYSKMAEDASNQETYEDFIAILDKAFTNGIKTLKNNRFAAVVVGDLRDKRGCYYNFHEDIKFIFNKAGMPLYNELILIESGATAGMRANNAMRNRKTVKTHQNILVFYKPEDGELPKIESVYRKIFLFYKGDPKDIKKEFPEMGYTNLDLDVDENDDKMNDFMND